MSIVKRLLLLITLVLLSGNDLRSQDCSSIPALSANLNWDFQIFTAPLYPGDVFFVECVVTGFTDVLSFQYSLSYDPTMLEFTSVDNTGSPLVGIVDGNFTPEQLETGSIPIIWTNQNGEGQTLPAGSEIYKLFFQVIGEPGDCSQWDINGSSVELEIAFELPNGDICSELVDINIDLSGGDLCIGCNDLYLTTDACGTTSSNGSIQFSACGGTAPYSYTVEGGSGVIATGSIGENEVVDLTGLDPDLYFIMLVDAVGSSPPFTQSAIDVVAADELTVDIIIVNDVPCPGFTGDLMAIGLGGAGNPDDYIYEWSNGLFTADLEDAPEGIYFVTITDVNGCQAVSPTSVTLEATPLNVTFTKVDATCDGSNDGSFSIFVTGGTPEPNDEYYFDNLLMGQGDYTNLNPGMYPVRVRDAKGCEELITITVEATTIPTYTINFRQEIECFGDMAIIEVMGDADPTSFPEIEYNNTPASVGFHPVTGFLEVFAPEAGNYTGTFLNNDGCEVEIDFDVTGVPEIVITLENKTDLDCDGTGGSIEVTAQGGVGNLSPQWDSGEIDFNISVDASGQYTLVVTDENFCTKELIVDIGSAGSIGLNAVVLSGVGCGPTAFAGSVEATTTSTSSNITYNWANSAGTDTWSTAIVTDLGAGTYFVTVTDEDANCSATADVTITGAGGFTFDIMQADPECHDGADGEIEVNIIGATPDGPPAWSHDANLGFNYAGNLTAGDYTVTVTDTDGCALETTITLGNPIATSMMVTDEVGVDCPNGSGGSATGMAFDSPSGIIQFTYYWESDASMFQSFGEESEPDDLTAGDWIAYAYDGACFTDTVSFVIQSPEEISIDSLTSLILDPNCPGADNGLIELDLGGGTGPFDFVWDDASIGNSISDLAPGNYSVEVTDDNSCVQTFDFTLSDPESLILEIDSTVTTNGSCLGGGSATIGVLPDGGVPGYTYDWTPNVSSTDIAYDVPAGAYTIQVTDDVGCTAVLVHEVTAVTPIEITFAPMEDIPCSGGTTDICIESISGGSGLGYTYQLNFGVAQPVGPDTCFSVNTGPFTLDITDGEGCPYEETITFDVPQPDPISIDLGAEVLELSLGDSSLVLDPIIIAPNPIDSIVWFSDNGPWDCLDPDCASISVSPTTPAFYFIDVVDEEGCTGTAKIFIDIKTIRNVWAPNIFTPDQDGDNDLFHPFTGPGVRQINSFYIYDRWGNLVHSAEDIAPGDEILNENSWDGRYNGIDAATGVYVFITEVEFIDDEIQFFKGSVTLTRVK